MRVWRDTECGTPVVLGMSQGPKERMGGDLGRQGFLRKRNEIFEGPGEGGGGGRRNRKMRSGEVGGEEQRKNMYLVI